MTATQLAAQDPVVRAALEEAGWKDGFTFDAEPWIDALVHDGYSVVEAAITVLRELGGLVVEPPPRSDAAFGSGTVNFDPIWAATGEAARIRGREAEFGRRLCPIGEWMGEYILLAGDDGAIYAETTFQMLRVGTGLATALARMIRADTPPDRLA